MAATLSETYIGRKQHAVLLGVMQALSTVDAAESMDTQIGIIARNLGVSVPTDDLFEDALGDLVAMYAAKMMKDARNNVRAIQAYPPPARVNTLKRLDATWNAPLAVKFELSATMPKKPTAKRRRSSPTAAVL
jgi:hypothetical protein